MRHRLHACNDSNCYVCRCDLQACEICGGAEGCLPKDCPGRSMTDEELKLVRRGVVNYVDGQWILLNNERYHKIRDVIAKSTCGGCAHFRDAPGLETWCDTKDKECVESKTPACDAYKAKDVLHYACTLCGKEPRKLVYGYGCPDDNCPNYRLDVSLEEWNDNAEAQKARKEKEDDNV